MSKYTVGYFIKKFSAIPKNQWTTGSYSNESGQRCALGHCGIYGEMLTHEAAELQQLLSDETGNINDNHYDFRYLGKHPRTRIINALKRVKAGRSI